MTRVTLKRSDEDVEILLFGTGKTMQMLPPAFRKHFAGLGIQVDVLDSVSHLFYDDSTQGHYFCSEKCMFDLQSLIRGRQGRRCGFTASRATHLPKRNN